MTHPYYPIFANLRGRRCVVIGGGAVAQRKVAALLKCGAAVTVVSPAITPRLARQAKRGMMTHRARAFRPGDLAGAWLAYAATNDPAVNAQVFRIATTRRIFVNVVDQKPLCSFIAPSMFTRGDLVVAVGTGGASPSMAKRVRQDLESVIGPEYASMTRLLKSLRGRAAQRLPRYEDRKRYFERLLAGPVFRLVRAGRLDEARRQATRLLDRAA